MGRTIDALGAACAIALIVAASPSGAGAPADAASNRRGTAADNAVRSTHRPGPVTILGSPEAPGIRFPLPRAEVGFLPVRPDPELEAVPPGADKRSAEVPR